MTSRKSITGALVNRRVITVAVTMATIAVLALNGTLLARA
jgi:hypothetical protein